MRQFQAKLDFADKVVRVQGVSGFKAALSMRLLKPIISGAQGYTKGKKKAESQEDYELVKIDLKKAVVIELNEDKDETEQLKQINEDLDAAEYREEDSSSKSLELGDSEFLEN